jgi:hypothetical protein
VRAPLAALLVLAIAGCSAKAEPSTTAMRIEATRVAALANALSTRGRAVLAGVLVLSSPETDRLHGLSDLRIDEAGKVTAVSDLGELLTARLKLNPDATLAGLDHAAMAPLIDLDGEPVTGKAMGDAEGLAVWPNGDLMVSFERNHRIWIYPADGGPPRPAPQPDARMGENTGMEGLALAPSQGPDAYWVGLEAGPVFLCRLSADCLQQPGVPQPGLGRRLSGLAETSRGELVILHHSYNPLTKASGLTVLLVRPGAEGARLIGRLALTASAVLDNYEGVETAPLPGGGLRLFLLVDDNGSATQRTLFTAIDWYPAHR